VEQVIVNLRETPDFLLQRNSIHRAELLPVAIISSDKTTTDEILEDVFIQTQNTDTLWHENKSILVAGKVRLADRKALRSVSVGDVLEYNGEMFVVESFGFQKAVPLSENLFYIGES